MRAADLAMYAAKVAGKGRYRTFDPTMLAGAVERLALERDLKLAVERDEIELHYQPVVDLVTGRARGVEALARWTHPERGAVGPDVFIPLAERDRPDRAARPAVVRGARATPSRRCVPGSGSPSS